MFNRVFSLALGCTAVAAIACSDDAGTANPVAQASTQTGSRDTSHTQPTSNGPVASVRIATHDVTVPVGSSVGLAVEALDANGARVSAASASWRSANVNIAVTLDSGVVLGKTVGQTKVYATIAGHSDSATVTVVAGSPPPPVTKPQPLASFDLNAVILGSLAGADSSTTEPVAGATVKLVRVGSISGDTLNPSIDAGSAVTNNAGAVSFNGLAGGFYTVSITPPAGSPYAATITGFGAPTVSPYLAQFKLSRKTP